jgi:hypothetical protein
MSLVLGVATVLGTILTLVGNIRRTSETLLRQCIKTTWNDVYPEFARKGA